MKCPAASCGGGYVFKCILEADHEGMHIPKIIPVMEPRRTSPTDKDTE